MGKNENLPEELILEILLRLPVKSLQRFKCVSKSWFSLISNPHFAKSHFEIAATPTHKLMLLAVSGSEARSIDLDAPFHDHAPAALKLNFLPPTSYHRIRITGSCNGFLLLSDDSTLFLWNPSTGFHKQLPRSPVSSNTSVFTFLYGFGYDESRDDYLVVQASYDDPSDANLVIHFEFFSVKANSWRKIEVAHLPYMYVAIFPKPGSLLNGAIHWLVLRYDDAWVDVIVAFDLMERSFSEIPLPSDFDDNGQFVDLRVLGGCLSLTIDAGDGDAAVIWVMEEYRVQSSWTMTSVEIPVEYFSPVCFTKSGAIVGIGGAGVLVKCNGEGEVLEDCTYFRDRRGCEAAMYTESLLSLPDEIGQAAENDRQQQTKRTKWSYL